MAKKQMQLGETSPVETALVEYAYNGQKWRCEHFDRLAAEIGLTEVGQLTLFHEQVSANERPWMIVRRLFGMKPVVPPASYSLDDLREWDRKDLYTTLGITRQQLLDELAAVRGAWSKIAPKPPPLLIEEKPAAPSGEFHFAQEALLQKYGFKPKGTVELLEWFASRVSDFEKLLNEKVTQGLARNVLMMELEIRQLDELMSDPESNRIGSADWRANQGVRQTMYKTYREQIDQILEKAPWASNIVGKYSVTGQLSEVTKSIQDYQSRGDTRLIDGMNTAMEVRVLCRRSVQTPAPQYRAGLVTFVSAAKAGLWDNNWQSPFERAELKRVDDAWRETFVKLCQEQGAPLPDLETDGPESEHPELREEKTTP